MNGSPHYPVMLNEVLEYLNPQDGEVYVDGTFGAGGYSRAILQAADCIVIAIDRDESAMVAAKKLEQEFSKRFVFVQGCFGDVEALLKKAGFEKVDGFVLDLGVSSMQLDQAERGFSFRFDGPLDMRMAQKGVEESAAQLVNEMEEKALADLIYRYGEERHSRKIARAIVLRREEKKFETTFDLAEVVRGAMPFSKKEKIDPATRTFQALRIAVNDELGELERALKAADQILAENGRLVVVSFHSLEDRMVKNDFRAKAGLDRAVSRHAPLSQQGDKAGFSLLTKKAIQAGEEEVARNARSRSAKLRAIQKTGGGV